MQNCNSLIRVAIASLLKIVIVNPERWKIFSVSIMNCTPDGSLVAHVVHEEPCLNEEICPRPLVESPLVHLDTLRGNGRVVMGVGCGNKILFDPFSYFYYQGVLLSSQQHIDAPMAFHEASSGTL